MLRLPFSSLPLFSFFFTPLPPAHTYIHIHADTRAHKHTYTQTPHTHTTAEFPAFSDTHTHIRFVNYPVASETSTRPRKVCPPPCTGFRGWATPWKIALLHDTISPGFAIPSYVRCSWEAEKRKERNCRRSHRFSSVIQISPLPRFSFVSPPIIKGTLRPYNLNQFLFNTERKNIVALESY